VTTAAEAVREIPARATVATGSGAAEPSDLLRALYARAGELDDIHLIGGLLVSGYDFLAGEGPFRLSTWFPPGTTAGAVARPFDYLPITWRQVNDQLRRERPDVCLIQLGPANADGVYGPGISSSHLRAMVESSALVIAEENQAMPRIGSAIGVHPSEIDIVVHTNRALPALPARAPQAADREVARHVVPWIPDGAALQVGVGAVPAATVAELVASGRRDLAVVGQFGEWAPSLFASGAASCAIVGEISGSAEVYQWADRNPAVQMVGAETTHGLLPCHPDRPFVCVNSALEVDLLGQVNSEALDGATVGPVGGLMDYAVAAGCRDQDRLVVALRSVTGSGRSRIRPVINGPVTVPRTLVQIVATEYGSVDLRGLSARDRARAIVPLASPQHRPALWTAVESMEQT
jgi:acyl-CoA hydrolase